MLGTEEKANSSHRTNTEAQGADARCDKALSSRKEEAKQWKQEQRRLRDEQRTATMSEGEVGSKSEKTPAETAASASVTARAGAALSLRKEEVKQWRQEQRQARDERKSTGSGGEDGRQAQPRSAGAAAEGACKEGEVPPPV